MIRQFFDWWLCQEIKRQYSLERTILAWKILDALMPVDFERGLVVRDIFEDT